MKHYMLVFRMADSEDAQARFFDDLVDLVIARSQIGAYEDETYARINGEYQKISE